MSTTTAADCPNCYTDNDDETDCPHLLAGDECPECGHELHKPSAGRVQCGRCNYVVNGQHMGSELRDFNLSARQGQRVLELFGKDPYSTPGNIENGLRTICHDHEIDREELNDVLDDLRRTGSYAGD